MEPKQIIKKIFKRPEKDEHPKQLFRTSLISRLKTSLQKLKSYNFLTDPIFLFSIVFCISINIILLRKVSNQTSILPTRIPLWLINTTNDRQLEESANLQLIPLVFLFFNVISLATAWLNYTIKPKIGYTLLILNNILTILMSLGITQILFLIK
jgi:hypothetical protein